MQPLRLSVFLALIAVLRCYELSQNKAEFYCVINGNFTDKEQVEKDGGGRTPVDVTFVPVFAPALSELPVMYLEESSAGVLLRALIEIITEGDDGTVYFNPYNFDGNADIKPGTFDPNLIKTFTMDNLQRQEDCRDAFERIRSFLFSVEWQNCKHPKVNGSRETYGSTDTCNEVILEVPVDAPEKSTLEPYRFKLQGDKYALENAPGNYVCDCSTTCN